MAQRSDGLPEPVAVADLFLAAILDELRAMRPSPVSPPGAGQVDLTEPAVRAPAAQVAEFVEPSSKRTRQRPRTP